MNDRKEFQEIGHSGGTVTFSVKVIDGRLAYQVGWSHSRPNAAALFAVYALPQGIVLARHRTRRYRLALERATGTRLLPGVRVV